MALLELKRSLLLPAILLAASLTLVGCGGTPTNNSDDKDSSSSSDSDKEDEAEEEEEEVDADASTESNCPLGFVQASQDMVQQEATVSILTVGEFTVPEVGLDILASGCLFSTTGDVDGTTFTSQSGYLPGGAAELAEISANLEAAGFVAMEGADGFYSRDTTSVVVFNSADLPGGAEAAGPLNLGFGDEFLVLSIINT